MKYDMRQPCDNCPFRNDENRVKLRRARVTEIIHALDRGEFPCHKTVDYDDEDGHGRATDESQHCAGALILLEREEKPSQMMRICERIGIYDPTKLKMDAPVFSSIQQMIQESL